MGLREGGGYALAKNRVARLRRDLDVARAEFAYQQRGIDMLSQ